MIFIGITTHQVKSYCEQLFFSRVQEIKKLSSSDVCVVDNSSDETYIQHLKTTYPEIRFEHLKIVSYPNSLKIHFRIATSCNMLRNIFLAGNYTHFLMIESDVLPPSNVVEELLSADKDIIEAPFYKGWHKKEYFDPNYNKILEVDTALTGCVLIKRCFLEKIEFGYDANLPAACPDAIFMYNAKKLGAKIYIHTGVKCQHLQNKDGGRGWNHFTKNER
jgi:hypothetical protein